MTSRADSADSVELEEGLQFFYVILSDHLDGKIAVRCLTGVELPMVADPDGSGTYIFFPDMMLFVRESVDEINETIMRKLSQIQAAWAPTGGVDPAGWAGDT